MGVTDAGDGASAPLPPDGIQPHPPTPPNTSVRIFLARRWLILIIKASIPGHIFTIVDYFLQYFYNVHKMKT